MHSGSRKTKLLICHAGYNSIEEAARAGVPIVMMPLFADQQINTARAIRVGLGIKVDKTDHLLADSVTAAIQRVLDPKSK